MADDSVMKNISQVEKYGSNLKKAQDDLRRIINDVRKQTDTISNIWNDKQFQNFKQDFKDYIDEPVMKAATMIDVEADYIKKITAFHREIQSTKLR